MSADWHQGTIDDVRQLVEERHLALPTGRFLTKAIAGEIRPNRDAPLWDLANVLYALGHAARGRGETPVDAIEAALFDRRRVTTTYLTSLFDGAPAGVRLTGDRLEVTAGTKGWSASYAAIGRTLALGDFIATGDELSMLPGLRAILLALTAPKVDADQARTDARRDLSRLLNEFRQRTMPLASCERRSRELETFLRQRYGRDGDTVEWMTDDDIIAFWQLLTAEDRRVQFRTAVARIRAYAEVIKEIAPRRQVSEAGSIDDRYDLAGPSLDEDAPDWATAWGDTLSELPPLAERLDRIPDVPNVLKGTEKQALMELLALAPWHQKKPLTVLRWLVFGYLQAIATQAERTRSKVASFAALAEANPDYAETVKSYQDAKAHLTLIAMIAHQLRKSDKNAPRETIRELKQVRRRGFDASIAELQPVFAAFDGDLADVLIAVNGFIEAAAKLDRTRGLGATYAKDVPLFLDQFEASYLQEATP